jgi:hypothetical protein
VAEYRAAVKAGTRVPTVRGPQKPRSVDPVADRLAAEEREALANFKPEPTGG